MGTAEIPTDLAPGAIRAALRSRLIAHPLEVRATVGSTNETAMAAGHRGAPEGFALLADCQTAGRGRLGRAWNSAPGVGLYTSVLLRPRVPPAAAPLLTLAAGLAVAEAIHETAGLSGRLKWPNDVLLDGRKVAGILTELATAGGSVAHVVVGVGINVNHAREDFPEALRETATSLRQALGRTVCRAELAATLYNALDRWYGRFAAREMAAILAAARDRMETLGREVEVAAGSERWRGRATGLDADGALLVQDGEGAQRRVLAGEVSIRPAEP